MTTLKYNNKPRWRQTAHVTRDRQPSVVCVALEPNAILLRLKGRRQVLRLPYGVAYDKAAWLESARIKLEKINAKKRKAEDRKRLVFA